jgi:hypothetical protein
MTETQSIFIDFKDFFKMFLVFMQQPTSQSEETYTSGG